MGAKRTFTGRDAAELLRIACALQLSFSYLEWGWSAACLL